MPLLLLWTVGLPGIMYIILRNNRYNLDSNETKLKYGFMYKEYHHRAYFWEFINMYKKIFIMIILNIYSQQIAMKGLLIYFTLTIYVILAIS